MTFFEKIFFMKIFFFKYLLVFCFSQNIFFSFAQNLEPFLKDIPKFDYTYKKIYGDPVFQNLKMIGEVDEFGAKGFYGKMLRSLRFKNITDLVEEHYRLPKNLIMAMIMQETGGVKVLPNGQNDGGLGICHMQGITAEAFGLKTICNKNCNFVCEKHGQLLKRIIKNNKNNLQKLLKYDDRFNILLNIDAVGRYLKYYREGKTNHASLKKAIKMYSGKKNFKKYWKKIKNYRKKLNKKKHINILEKKFNEINKNLMINGNKGNLKEYLRVSRLMNYNFALKKYENLFGKKNRILIQEDTYLLIKEEIDPKKDFKYKYTVGEDYSLKRVESLLEEIKKIKNFENSFIKKDTIYKIQIMASNRLISKFKNLDDLGINVQVYKIDEEKFFPFKYMIGGDNKENIFEKLKEINQIKNYEKAFVKEGVFYKIQISASKKSLIENKSVFLPILQVLNEHKKKYIK